MFRDLYLNSKCGQMKVSTAVGEQYDVVRQDMDKLATMMGQDWFLIRWKPFCTVRVLSMPDGALAACLGMVVAELGPELIKKVKAKKQKKTESEEGA